MRERHARTIFLMIGSSRFFSDRRLLASTAHDLIDGEGTGALCSGVILLVVEGIESSSGYNDEAIVVEVIEDLIYVVAKPRLEWRPLLGGQLVLPRQLLDSLDLD